MEREREEKSLKVKVCHLQGKQKTVEKGFSKLEARVFFHKFLLFFGVDQNAL